MSRLSFIAKPGDLAQTRHFAPIRMPLGPLFAYANSSPPWGIRKVTCCRATIDSGRFQPTRALRPLRGDTVDRATDSAAAPDGATPQVQTPRIV